MKNKNKEHTDEHGHKKAKIFPGFPQPKFQIGQEVYILSNRTKELVDRTVHVVIEIHLACVSVVAEIGFLQNKEAFIYFVIPAEQMGRKYSSCSAIREPFLAPV